MGITKTIGFSRETNEMADMLKALGHPARLAIIQLLMKSNTCICGDIVEILPLAQSTVSKHLSELKKVGLIKGTITGNNICYCIDEVGFEKLKYFFQNVNKHLEKNKTSLFQILFDTIS
jgi:ArsR family transcriptional regulator, arsenate/arsenite/antimonite-responsive transcriptional repressor